MKSNSWPEVLLGDHVDFLTGFPFKSAKYIDDPTGIRLLRGDNVVQGALRWENCKRWTSSEIEQFSKYSLEYNDVVLAMDRPWIEAGLKWAYIKGSDLPCLLVQRVSRLRGKNGLLTNFIRYIISDINFTNYVKSVITGINIPHISGPQIQAYQFRLPPIKTQQKIASILSNYDDLIENNTRRIEILEQMAKLVYEEWFVKFRFPGHEKVKMGSSELGEIPEGWEVEKLSELVKTQYGYTESATEEEIGPKFLRGKDINKQSYISWDEVPFCSISPEVLDKYLLKKGDIVVIRMADPGKVGIVETEVNAVFASYLIRLEIIKNIKPYYLFYFLQSDKFQNYVTAASTGTTRKSASAGVITNIDLIIPPEYLLTLFEDKIGLLRKQLNILINKNQNLRKTRDLLLPKLISGEIDVSDLDIHIRDELEVSQIQKTENKSESITSF
ncbi:restriction endonuclease subunit S [Methanosarcina sp. UBA5]|uniref:restriction endonuclease subunit S n=1 Tax=Methanosarcina sp. UBA5 TaxID=1915593 RepID=UPI0025F595A4|nr:restriction endonuclease subunit S [Methanosarcina sp. UBA5]